MVLIDGYYGNKNTGDDIFVINLYYIFGKKAKFLTNERLAGIPTLCFLPKNVFRGWQKLYFLFLLIRYRIYITGGGSVFEEKQKISTFRGLALLVNKFIPIDMYAVGVSLSPKENELCYVIKEISSYKKVLVRDNASYKFSQQFNLENVERGVDLAYLIELNTKSQKTEILSIVHCPFESVRKLDVSNEIRRDEMILGYILELMSSNSFQEVQLLEFNGHQIDGDLKKVNYLKNSLKNLGIPVTVINYSVDTSVIINALAQSKFVIATRLHGAIISHVLEIPFLLVEYHNKCTDWLDTINFPEYARIGDAICSEKDIVNVFKKSFVYFHEGEGKKELSKLLINGRHVRETFSHIVDNRSSF